MACDIYQRFAYFSVVCLARLIVAAATVEGCIFTVVPKCLLTVTVS